MPKPDEMEYKFLEVPFEVKFDESKETAGMFVFEGYASTKDLDLVDDVVVPTAFNESLSVRMPKLLWQHNRDEPVGTFLECRPDDKGLFIKAQMPTADTFVSGRVIPQMKIGSISAMSIGYRVKQAEFDTDTGVRTIMKADLMEVSLVTFPANPEARITALKALADAISEDEEELEGKLSESQIKDLPVSHLRKAIQEGKLSRNAARIVAETFISSGSEDKGNQDTSGLDESDDSGDTDTLEAARLFHKSIEEVIKNGD